MELTWKEDFDSAKKEFGLWHLPATFYLHIKSNLNHLWPIKLGGEDDQ
jgi:hypothetical protein